MVERVDGVVKVPYAVWSASNEQLWSTSVHVLGRVSSRESRFVRNFDGEGLPPGLGESQDTLVNKGIFVIQQFTFTSRKFPDGI